MVECNKHNLYGVTFCFPKTQSELNHFGPPTNVLSSLPKNASQKSMRWQKGKHLLCALSLSNIYTESAGLRHPKSTINHFGLKGDPIKKTKKKP